MRVLLDKNKKDVIIALEKEAKKSGKMYFLALAEAIDVPSRNFSAVPIEKIKKLAKDPFVFVIPGKVIGSLPEKLDVQIYAFSYSESARNSLKKPKSLMDLIKDKPSNIVIVK